MPQPLNLAIVLCYMLTYSPIFTTKTPSALSIPYSTPKQDSTKPKIQVAILLDVSNSMDGLIEQAKDQLWNMVKVLGKAKCGEENPQIEIALYEYGRPANGSQKGYIENISPFTSDLDNLFFSLQSLTTNGGDEYCEHVISTAIDCLSWDSSKSSYKVIFIAGNESFLQGAVTWIDACKKAKEKGIIVNTIFCGGWDRGVREHWNLGAECGNGSFTNIDQNSKEESIPSPYDSTLFVLNERLNQTYIYYGAEGYDRHHAMIQMDTVPISDVKDISKIMNYVVVKSDRNLYNRSKWDLIDANEKDSTIIDTVDMKTLPDDLKNKSRRELKLEVAKKTADRLKIRKMITDLNFKRDSFISAEKIKLKINDSQTLQTEIEKMIREQVTRFKMKIE